MPSPAGGSATWNGSPTTLQVNDSVTLNPSTNGSMVLAAFNTDSQNNAGQLLLTWGGNPPITLDVAALQNAPILLTQDFGGNALTVTNISQQAPIWLAIYGPGLASSNPGALPDTGQFYSLGLYTIRSTISAATFQRLVFNSDKNYTVFVLFSGPDVKTLVINAPETVTGYDVRTPDNNYPLTQNWMGQTLWVINLSPGASTDGQISLTTL